MPDHGTRWSGRTVTRLTLAMGLALVVSGAWNWVLRPDEPLRWLRGMLLVPGAWCGMTLYRRLVVGSARDRSEADQAAVRRYFESAMLLVVAAGAPILVGYGLRIWTTFFPSFDAGTGARILTCTAGLVFVVVGNVLPKILTPLSMLPRGRAGRQQEARRFLGLVMVLLGLTFAAASIVAPLGVLSRVGRWTPAVFVLSTVAAIVWMNVAPAQPEARA